MTSRFFVATMPRSRSAWLSVLLTTPGHYVLHEAVRTHGVFREDGRVSVNYPEGVSGATGCDLALWPSVIDAGAPLVVVWREPGVSRKSAVRASGQVSETELLVERCVEGLLSLRSDADHWVDFEDLRYSDNVVTLAQVLGVEVSLENVQRMQDYIVEYNPERYSGAPGFAGVLRERLGGKET